MMIEDYPVVKRNCQFEPLRMLKWEAGSEDMRAGFEPRVVCRQAPAKMHP